MNKYTQSPVQESSVDLKPSKEDGDTNETKEIPDQDNQ